MTKSTRVDLAKLTGVFFGGIAIGISILGVLGVPKCSELQTAAASTKALEEVKSAISEVEKINYQEHRDFRKAIKENSDTTNKNMQKILERLPPK